MKDSSWIITESGWPSRDETTERGNRFLVGNGICGVRGSLDEGRREDKVGVLFNGLYDRKGSSWREPVNLPNPFYVALPESCGQVESHLHGVDMGHGLQFRETLFRDTEGKGRIKVESQRFASQHIPGLLGLRYTLSVDFDTTIRLKTGIDTDIWDINGPHLESFSASRDREIRHIRALTGEERIPVVVSVIDRYPEALPSSDISGEGTDFDTLEIELKAGNRFVMERLAFVCHGRRREFDQAGALLETAADQGFSEVEKEHREAWGDLWDRADLRIEGDQKAQRAMRFCLYHLLSSLPPEGENLSIPARGLSGQVYKGAIFWDTELFMLPFYGLVLPERAKGLLRYRIDTLQGAERKAESLGWSGAFYPWESQETGDDACTDFNVTDILTNRPIRTFFRDGQIHISSDVALAIWEGFRKTGDPELLLGGGAEVIYACAAFLWSRAHIETFSGRWVMMDVTGPDEYHERVHNDAFTNLAAKATIKACLDMDKWLRENHPPVHQRLLENGSVPPGKFRGIGIDAYMEQLRDFHRHIKIQEPNQEGIIPQFDGYLDLEDPSITELLKRKGHPHEYLGGGNGLARWTRIIKQADVVLALAQFPGLYESWVEEANWIFYERRTEHGSSLSATAYSLLASRLGHVDQAYRYFMDSAEVDLRDGGKTYVGDLYIGGLHPASQGGAWRSVVEGFCGLEYDDTFLRMTPRLPRSWSGVSFSARLGTRTYRLRAEPNRWSLICGDMQAEFNSGETYHIQVEEKKGDLNAMLETMKGALFDLDGVLVDTAKYHYQAWKRLADELGVEFDETRNEELKGVSRMESLQRILDWGGRTLDESTMKELADRKNAWYVELIQSMDPEEILPGAREYIETLKSREVKIALGSASKNARVILRKTELEDLFDAVIDGTVTSASKPDPQVFLLGAQALGLDPGDCVVFEDAAAGIEAARRAGASCIGIGSPENLREADLVVPSLEKLIEEPQLRG